MFANKFWLEFCWLFQLLSLTKSNMATTSYVIADDVIKTVMSEEIQGIQVNMQQNLAAALTSQ